MDKKQLSERDICTKFITPALRRAGWGNKGSKAQAVAAGRSAFG
jgi:type I restriction enzyme R subunit